MNYSIEVIPPLYKKQESSIVVFDTGWFQNTHPSFKNYKDFVPEWENDSKDIGFYYFLAWNSQKLLEDNTNILCPAAQQALKKYNQTENDDISMVSYFNPKNTGLYDIEDLNKLVYNRLLFVEGHTIIKDFDFIIINSAGTKVFHTNNRSIGWDGKFNDEFVQSGEYNWQIKGLVDSKEINLNGILTIEYA